MSRLIESLDHLLPSLLMASGVMLLAAGALAYAPATPNGAAASPAGSAAGDPLFASSLPGQSAVPQPTGAGSPIAIGPSPTPLPSASTTGPLGYASRIVIPSLNIDLPIVAGDLQVPGNADGYPLCDVAMYMPDFVQPGEPGTTYIYAHAQRGMFLPLLRASLVDGGAAMVGALVEVYTTTDELHLYQISVVKPHATDLSLATQNGATEQLVLQTSEGPSGTVPKLQIAATPVSTVPAAGDAAMPSAAPRVCPAPTAQP
jgi:sortase (surface protein transpeptidase)